MQGPWDPATRRQTSIVITRRATTADYRIVTSISTRSSTEVLAIDPASGELNFDLDISYDHESQALQQLHERGYEIIERGYALLGYAVVGTTAGILLATRVRDKGTLPGGHSIHLITDSKWVLVPLVALQQQQKDAYDSFFDGGNGDGNGGTSRTSSSFSGTNINNTISNTINNTYIDKQTEIDFWRSIQQNTVNNAHYYCETADLTRPFPSPHPPTNPLSEFVWNAWLSTPLKRLGLLSHCPVLIQGAAEVCTQNAPSLPATKNTTTYNNNNNNTNEGSSSSSSSTPSSPSYNNNLNTNNDRYAMALLSRRSRVHPGTRYLARGLNRCAAPGNELESELVVWTWPSSNSGSSNNNNRDVLRWARCVWRRGTVPIWWGVALQSQGLQTEIWVKDHDTYVGTYTYFRHLQRKYAEEIMIDDDDDDDDDDDGDGDGDGATTTTTTTTTKQQQHLEGTEEDVSFKVPITCINLLHANPKKASELMLSEHFMAGIRHVGSLLTSTTSCSSSKSSKVVSSTMRPLASSAVVTPTRAETPIKVVNFDWHGVMGSLTEERGVEAFWSFMEGHLKKTGMAYGTMQPSNNSNGSTNSSGSSNDGDDRVIRTTPWGAGWQMAWRQSQQGLLRFNCADSLDRTNAATCFAILPVLQEALRCIHIDLAAPPKQHSTIHPSPSSSGGVTKSSSARQLKSDLPPGWEVVMHNGRPLYIDHISKKTQWNVPSGAAVPGNDMMNNSSRNYERMPVSASEPSLVDISRSSGGQDHASSATSVVPPSSAPPPPLPEWGFYTNNLAYSIEKVKETLATGPLTDYVEMFKVHGDIHAFLYTGSPAMHSHVLNILLPMSSRNAATAAGVGKLQNIKVAIVRRWNNTVSDAARQQSIELFLGRSFDKYCPGLVPLYREEGIDFDKLEVNDVSAAATTALLDAANKGGGGEMKEEEEEEEVGGDVPGLRHHDGRVGVLVGDLSELEPLDDDGGDPLGVDQNIENLSLI